MGAYNYAHYVGRAIESALAQDYPPELLEIIVIDDGSPDNTAEVVGGFVERHPGRVRLIRQANAGPTAATNRAMSEATGDMLCLLDADDVWLPSKVRRQVELMQARPDVGLVFCDMALVDGDERPTGKAQLAQLGGLPQRVFPRVLFANVATQSSIMIRASLRELFDPIPVEIPYADWWLSLRAAQVSELDYVHEALALYRQHGANLTGGVTGAAGVREHRKEVAFQLWALRHLPLEQLTPSEMLYVWSGVEEHAREVVMSAGSMFVELAAVDDAGRARADELLCQADELRAEGDFVAEAALTLRALAFDPFRVGAHNRLAVTAARAAAAPALPHPLPGARGFVVLTDAEELLADDDMMLAYVDGLSGSAIITMAIDASRMPVQSVSQDLQALVDRCELGDRHDIDLIAVTGSLDAAQRRRLLRAVHARYRREDDELGELPAFTPASVGELREFARTAARLGLDTARRSLVSSDARVLAVAA